MNPITNTLTNVVTYMTKKDALGPILGLEATVTGGRTIQAYKRGGEDEARERLIEESTGAVVWLGGVKVLNDYVGDPILKKLFGENFDVGKDKLRTPFDNFIKEYPGKKRFSPKQIALIKATKVLASVLIADAFIGLVVPPLNQKLTKNLRNKRKDNANENTQDKLELSSQKSNDKTNPSFKGGGALNAINIFTNAIENTNTGKLLSTDAGLVSGRMYSARNNEERREIAIRDIGSIYFYMWAQGHVGKLMNFAETGRFTRIDPNSVEILDEYLTRFINSKNGGISVEEFRNAVLGKNPSEIKLPEGIKFETEDLSKFTKFFDRFRKTPTEPLQVAELDNILKEFTDDVIIERLRKMAELQPERCGKRVITKQQIIDAINISEINNPELLDKVFNKFTDGNHNKKYKYVSNKSLYDLKAQMEDYIADICKNAKDGKITKDVIKKAKNRNLIFSGINFVTGFAFAALFLSTLIPKIQYWYTKVTTGKHEFPGTYDEK